MFVHEHMQQFSGCCPWKYKDCRPTAGGVKWYSSLQELSLNYNVSIEECERRRIEAMKAKGLIA